MKSIIFERTDQIPETLEDHISKKTRGIIQRRKSIIILWQKFIPVWRRKLTLEILEFRVFVIHDPSNKYKLHQQLQNIASQSFIIN